jgi:hypothetical protein
LSPFTLKINAQPFISPTDAIRKQELTNRLKTYLDAKKVSLRDLQSLLGLLNFACQVVAPGRAFKCLHHHQAKKHPNNAKDLDYRNEFL